MLAEVTIPDNWILAFGVFFLGQIVAAGAWGYRLQNTVTALKQDIESMKAWQQDRMKPIEEYYNRQELLSSRITTVEEQSRANAKSLDRIEGKIDRLIERDHGG